MRTIKVILDIREEDIDGNKIDVEEEKNAILESLKKFWNVAGIDITEEKGK